VIDVTDLSAPQQVGVLPTQDEPVTLDVAGGYAYVAEWEGLEVIDVTTPISPTQVGLSGIPGGPQDVTVAGDYAYVVSDGLRVVDATTPSAPLMIDEDVVAVSPSSVYRVLVEADRLKPRAASPSTKGTRFVQPSRPHEHWHIHVAYVHISGTFYYLRVLIDGLSRYIVSWDLRESMTEADIEIVIQRAREAFPGLLTPIISDNGPQFVARDLKEFARIGGLTHVRTSPYYPQSNGKCERWWLTSKPALRSKAPLSLEDARRILTDFVAYYNDHRLHSAIGYVTPEAMLNGRADSVIAARFEKLAAARALRQAELRAS